MRDRPTTRAETETRRTQQATSTPRGTGENVDASDARLADALPNSPVREDDASERARDRDPGLSTVAWDDLKRELLRIKGPRQRATSEVRTGARRVAREMLVGGATTVHVRDALTELVAEVQGAVPQVRANADPRREYSLLADVLQCALGGDMSTDVALVDERRTG